MKIRKKQFEVIESRSQQWTKTSLAKQFVKADEQACVDKSNCIAPSKVPGTSSGEAHAFGGIA